MFLLLCLMSTYLSRRSLITIKLRCFEVVESGILKSFLKSFCEKLSLYKIQFEVDMR